MKNRISIRDAKKNRFARKDKIENESLKDRVLDLIVENEDLEKKLAKSEYWEKYYERRCDKYWDLDKEVNKLKDEIKKVRDMLYWSNAKPIEKPMFSKEHFSYYTLLTSLQYENKQLHEHIRLLEHQSNTPNDKQEKKKIII